MIAAGIESASVEVPVVLSDDQKIGTDVVATALFETADELVVFSNRSGRRRRKLLRELLVQTYDAVGINGLMNGIQPLALGVPKGKPGGAISGHLQCGIFEQP